MHGQTNIKTLVPFHKSDNADVVLQIVGDSNLDRKLTAPTELLRGFPHTPWQLPSQYPSYPLATAITVPPYPLTTAITVPLIPPGNCHHSTSNLVKTTFLLVHLNSWLTKRRITGNYVHWATGNEVKRILLLLSSSSLLPFFLLRSKETSGFAARCVLVTRRSTVRIS